MFTVTFVAILFQFPNTEYNCLCILCIRSKRETGESVIWSWQYNLRRLWITRSKMGVSHKLITLLNSLILYIIYGFGRLWWSLYMIEKFYYILCLFLLVWMYLEDLRIGCFSVSVLSVVLRNFLLVIAILCTFATEEFRLKWFVLWVLSLR